MRGDIKRLYSETFSKRVDNMSDAQVFAIWMRIFSPKDKKGSKS